MVRIPLKAAHLGVGLGLVGFAYPPLLLGAHHASLLWLIAWAMFWSPPFCLVEANRPNVIGPHQVARILARFSVGAAKIFAALCPLYAAGWLIDL
jgi:hypothetical protein